jgi:hypothetical protein
VFADSEYSVSYKFNAKLNDPKTGYVDLYYFNTSSYAQCILASDFEMKLPGDSLILKDGAGVPIKYIGPMMSLSVFNPQEYLIIPPGMKTMTSIYLNEYYRIKKLKTISFGYRIPVIPCEKVLKKYVRTPHPSFIKDKVHSYEAEKTEVFKTDYPEWTEFGFIANLEPLLIERKK